MDDIDKDNPEIMIKRFISVIFGVNNSPNLLCSTVRKRVNKYRDTYFEKILRDIYVDDLTSGAQSKEAGFDFYLFLKILIQEGGFILCKWVCSDPNLQIRIDKNELSLDQDNSCFHKDSLKVLGVTWNVKNDELVVSNDEVINTVL